MIGVASTLTAAGAGWRGFVRRHGWRAYAVVVLAAVSVVVVVRGDPDAHSAAASAGPRPGPVRGSVAEFHQPAPLVPVTIATTSESTRCGTNSYPQLALVSLHEQRVWMCAGHRQVYTTAVTTGATVGHNQTPVGSWRVQSRERNRYLVGVGYRDYVHYWVPFNGDFGFHDATWQTMKFGSKNYVTQGSHGCVHMPMAAMKWFYGWSRVDDTVVDVQA